jgi:hypothetical protein
MRLIVTFTDGSHHLAANTEHAEELILAAFSNGALVDTIEDEQGIEYGATWSVAVAKL